MNHMSTTIKNEQGMKAKSTPDGRGTTDCQRPEDAVTNDHLDSVKRLSWRFPRNRQVRAALMWMVAAQLLVEGLPIPSDAELEALTARYCQVAIAVVGNPQTRQSCDRERVRAHMKEFLHLACPPAPPEPEAM